MKKSWVKNPYYHQKETGGSFKNNLFEYVLTGLIGTIIFGSLVYFLMICFDLVLIECEGVSMKPTFDDGVVLNVNTSNRALDSLTYHDIIDFTALDSNLKPDNFVKRIIGLPGDTIEIRDKKLYINGEYVEEDFIIEDTSNAPTGPITLKEDEYFVMGDNRAQSDDSRHVIIGAVHKSQILGRVFGGVHEENGKEYNFIRRYE